VSNTGLREQAFLVLTALAAEPQHGYAVMENVLQMSEGRVRLHTGSLYAIIDRLREMGLIEVDREEIVASRLRRYYRLTGAGVQRLDDEIRAMRRHADAAAARLRRFRALHDGGAA
jgi:DNA-binding PadR family transcriptional regulator